jgi:hypothetical protein
MNGFGWAFLIVGLVSIYALGLLGYNLMLSAKKLSVQIEKSQELIAELNSFETPNPAKTEPNTGADLVSLLGQRLRLRLSREQRTKARRRRLMQHIKDIDTDKR